MESKLIDSLTEDHITKGFKPMVGNMFNAKGMNNMGIIPKLIRPPAEIPKEYIYNRRIPLEDFPIFSKPNPLDVVIGFLENFHVGVILADSETTSKKTRNVYKKHSERIARKFKAARETLDTYTKETIDVGSTSSAGTTFGMFAPSKARLLTIYNISSIPSTTLTSPT